MKGFGKRNELNKDNTDRIKKIVLPTKEFTSNQSIDGKKILIKARKSHSTGDIENAIKYYKFFLDKVKTSTSSLDPSSCIT